MISGGDSAMMSPVVRISRPALEGLEEAREGALAPAAPAIGSNSMAPIRPILRMSMTCGQALERMERVLPIGRELGGAGQQALLLVGVERGEAGGAGHRVARIGVAVEELDDVLRARS